MSPSRRRIGLVGRFTIGAAIGALIIGLVAMFSIDRYATAALLARVEQSNQSLAERLAIGFDERVAREVAALKVAARDENIAALRPKRATTELATAMRAPSDYDALTLHDIRGRVVAAAASRFLADPTIMTSRRELVTEARAAGSVVRAIRDPGPILEIAVPVESPPGTVVGALIAQIPFNVIGSRISSSRVGDGGTASLLDSDGRTLVHQDQGRVVRAQPFDLLSGKEDAGSTTTQRVDDDDVLISVAPMTIFPGVIAIEQTLADATRPISVARRNLIVIVLAAVAGTAAVISYAGRRVLAPIGPLMGAVRDLGSGIRSARAPVPTRRDEISLLSEQFNRMAHTLEGLDRAKSEFVANAAHELRTPLTVISGLVTLLPQREEMHPDEYLDLCRRLERQTERGRILVERMLDLLRIESGRVVAEWHPLIVGVVVHRALEATPAPEGRTITVEVDPGLAAAGDEVALEQVFSNLLTNAYRYGGSTIVIRSVPQADSVQVIVEDDGDGVPTTVSDHIFEPFNRGARATGVGSGLGLAIVSRLMKAMDGSVRYEERSPHGARFIVELTKHHRATGDD